MSGVTCSTTGRHRHCLRLKGALSWSGKLENKIAQLGGIIGTMNNKTTGKQNVK